MDPITLLLTALAGAAGALGKEAADDAVKTAYAKLKGMLVDRFKFKSDVEDALIKVEARPDSAGRQQMLREELESTTAINDPEVIQQAQALMELLSKSGSGNFIAGRDIHLNFYAGEVPQDDKERLDAYLRMFISTYRSLPLRGINVGTSDPTSGQKSLDLDHVYVNLDTTLSVSGTKEKPGILRQRQELEEDELRPYPVLRAAVKNQKVVIVGDPGSGKSTFVNHLGLCLALHHLEPKAQWLKRLEEWNAIGKDLVPITVVLRDFAKSLPETTTKAEAHHLWDFIVERLTKQNLVFVKPLLGQKLDDGHALVLFDGLDEISSKSQRTFVRDAVLEFVKRYPKSRVIVTCRTLSYQDATVQLAEWPSFEIAKLDEEKIDAFISAWYGENERLGVVKPREGEGLAKALQQAIRRQDLWRLAPNPLLLTVMALVHTHKGRLPDARALLYEDTVDILLWRWEQMKAGGADEGTPIRRLLQEAGRTDVDLKRVLWRLAFEAHQQAGVTDGEGLADIGELSLIKALTSLHPDRSHDWAYKVVETMKHRAGLLLERAPELYTFPHRTFQEYLAGSHLAAQAGFSTQATKLVEDGAFWREVILLAVGRLVYPTGDYDKPLALVGELCPENSTDSELAWRKAWLAGDVLKELGKHRAHDSQLGKDLWARVQKRLVALMRESDLTPRERAEAANTLSDLGDPRFREDAWALAKEAELGFLEISDGPFFMGTKKKDIPALVNNFGGDKEWYDDETEQHEIHLPTYYISRYSVTVAQFKSLVEQTGYEIQHQEALKGLANHPVVYVTWSEAVAYCEWLTQTLREWKDIPTTLAKLLRPKESGGEGGRITLPSEPEWEKAARGATCWNFPWGNDADSTRVNYYDTGISTTSTVGCFPGGKSPNGVEDMSGNVWEWTRSVWGESLSHGC